MHRRPVRLPPPQLWDGAALLSIPASPGLAHVCAVGESWSTPLGSKRHGVVFELQGTPPDAPLLLAVLDARHSPLLSTRSGAAASAAAPLHALLRCGYRVLALSCGCPEDGGECGGTDEFLDDALAGAAAVLEKRLPPSDAAEVPIGAIGSGLGGHLVLRALAHSSRRVVAGVCIGGFVSEASRALVTGDVPHGVSSLPSPVASASGADVSSELGEVTSPLLLVHGEQDAVSPPSASMAVYNHLHARDVPTELALYPGEPHLLQGLDARRDAARRICAWLLTHIPAERLPRFG